MTSIVLLACVASTLFMTGLIWFVQVVHYPLFDHVGPDAFERYHAAHTRRTTIVVLVPMCVELITSIWLAVDPPASSSARLAQAGAVAALVTWGSTVFVQVPLHDRLARAFDQQTVHRLVTTNAVRMVAWTAHAAIVLAMTGQALR